MGQRGRDTPKGPSHILLPGSAAGSIQSQPGHLHVQPPQNAKRCLNELNSHPTAISGEIQIPGDSESPALPLHEHSWEPLGTAQEGKDFF